MRIGFVGRGQVSNYAETEGERADVVLFAFDGAEVSYEKELKGETCFFESVARLSKRENNVVVFGCITDTMGIRRKSVLVASSGKSLGVSDMLNAVDGEVGAGAGLRVYDTAVGKMGVIVAEDLCFSDTARALSLCGSDFIVCPFGEVESELQKTLVCANAYFSGTPVLFCGKNRCIAADSSGEVLFSSPHSPVYFDCQIQKEYHLIETRRKGCFGTRI